jgi:hypothetical protein
MSDVYSSDAEWALRSYLRTVLGSGIKVWLGQPQGTPTLPMVVITGRLGGGPDLYIPLDDPRVSFDCWGPAGGNGRKAAVDTKRALITALAGMDGVKLDADTLCYGAYEITDRWAPDDTDPDNVIPRYVVDASLTLRSP